LEVEDTIEDLLNKEPTILTPDKKEKKTEPIIIIGEEEKEEEATYKTSLYNSYVIS